MIRFEDLIEKVRAANPEADTELLRRAYVFSAYEHKGQVRRSGEPYLVHPLEVADILADLRLDVVAIAAGLLHDIVEDTPNTIEKVRELFGEQVAHVVEGVTKLSGLQFSSSEERQAESFRKMLLAMVDDIRVILVKLADRLHNMRTLHHLPEERRTRIAQETRDIYAPIAHRLGMGKVKNELEELAFRYIEPAAYQALRQQVEAQAAGDRRADRRAAQAARAEARRGADSRSSRSTAGSSASGRSTRSCSARRSRSIRSTTSSRCASSRGASRTATRCSASSTRCGRRCRAGSRTSSRCRGRTAISRCTRRSSASAACRSRCRSAPRRCTASPRRASRRTGSTRKAASAPERDEQTFSWLRQLLEWQQDVARSARVHAEPADRAVPGRGLHLHAEGRGEVAAARRDAGRLRLLRSTPTSATSASARGSTAAWCRCAPRSTTATSSRSSRRPATSPAATG